MRPVEGPPMAWHASCMMQSMPFFPSHAKTCRKIHLLFFLAILVGSVPSCFAKRSAGFVSGPSFTLTPNGCRRLTHGTYLLGTGEKFVSMVIEDKITLCYLPKEPSMVTTFTHTAGH